MIPIQEHGFGSDIGKIKSKTLEELNLNVKNLLDTDLNTRPFYKRVNVLKLDGTKEIQEAFPHVRASVKKDLNGEPTNSFALIGINANVIFYEALYKEKDTDYRIINEIPYTTAIAQLTSAGNLQSTFYQGDYLYSIVTPADYSTTTKNRDVFIAIKKLNVKTGVVIYNKKILLYHNEFEVIAKGFAMIQTSIDEIKKKFIVGVFKPQGSGHNFYDLYLMKFDLETGNLILEKKASEISGLPPHFTFNRTGVVGEGLKGIWRLDFKNGNGMITGYAYSVPNAPQVYFYGLFLDDSFNLRKFITETDGGTIAQNTPLYILQGYSYSTIGYTYALHKQDSQGGSFWYDIWTSQKGFNYNPFFKGVDGNYYCAVYFSFKKTISGKTTTFCPYIALFNISGNLLRNAECDWISLDDPNNNIQSSYALKRENNKDIISVSTTGEIDLSNLNPIIKYYSTKRNFTSRVNLVNHFNYNEYLKNGNPPIEIMLKDAQIL